jgi:hypothetical protein
MIIKELNFKMKRALSLILITATMLLSTSCEYLDSEVQEMEGSIKGCTYDCMFFDNEGELFMTATGENIDLSSNIVKEETYSDGSWGYAETLSSVVTITIDGNQLESCGSTIIFAENTLSPDVDFTAIESIESTSDGSLTDWTSVAGLVNKYKNMFGKPAICVIQSQLGDPICAYSGDEVYWEVCEDLPKTTKLMIDGQALYIHRANFQIIDKDLLN